MAPSSSASKVAKLASRGKGKKVRFSGGTTFPVVAASATLAMLGLITYAKLTTPSEASGAPFAGDQWTMAYEFRVCDTTFTLEGDPADLQGDASAGDRNDLEAGTSSPAGFINYHPQVGGNTGGKARLGVWLDVYGVGLSTDKLVIPADQADGTETVYDVNDSSVFDGTSCEGQDATIKVRVWDNASSGGFEDKITAFRGLQFTDNGMAWVIAVVPKDNDFEIPKPASASRIEEFTAVDATADTTVDSTPDSTADTTVDSTADTTVDSTASVTPTATT